MVNRINHVAIVVEDLDAALRFWRDALGLPLRRNEINPGEGVNIAFLPVGESEIELLQPISEDSGVGKYLAKKGQGVHHICVEVDDIEGALERLRAHGVRLIDETPTIGTGGKKVAFIHPESTHGVLVELYEMTPEEPLLRAERQMGLANRVLHEGQVMTAAVRGFLQALARNGQRAWNGEARETRPDRREQN